MSNFTGIESFCGGNFWDTDLTWNTDNPRFTLCFERTVFVWIPCFFLWIVSFFEIEMLLKSNNRNIPWTLLNISKIAGGSCLMILQFLELGYHINRNNDYPESSYPNDFFAPSVLFLTFFLYTVFLVLEIKRGIQSSGFVFVFWLLMVVCGSFQVRNEEMQLFSSVVYYVQYALVVFMFLLNCFADARPKFTAYPRGPNASPEVDASFLNRLFFFWMTSMIWRGSKNTLQHSDLYDLIEDNTSETVVRKWSRNVQKVLDKSKVKVPPKPSATYLSEYSSVNMEYQTPKTPKISVLPVMVRTYGLDILIGTIISILYNILLFVSPFILHLLIEFTEDPEIEKWKGYFYSIVMFFTTMLGSILLGQSSMRMYQVGARLRTGITTSVYQKALKISSAARRSRTVGEMVNLMSVDSQRFMELATYITNLFSAPVTIGLAIASLYAVLGPSSIAGVAVLLCLIPANGAITAQLRKLQIAQMKFKDERVKLINEILNGMKVLKLYAWEESFERKILEIRQREILLMRKAAYYNALMSFVFTCTPFLVTMMMFITYVYSDSSHMLDPNKIFVSISLVNILRMPLFMVPFLLVSGVQSFVSLKRMNNFLNADEIDPAAVITDPNIDKAISISKGTFTWDTTAENNFTLSDINLTIEPGTLVAIVGVVGTGKSSLCSAMLGEMIRQTGSVTVKSKIAYVPQTAWIQNSVLRDNILFGHDYNEDRYKQTLEACALVEDLAILPAGDSTEIGEKGINLSGGQKQRVSLARAVYSNYDIYILDDPLSAVDSHVGKHIFTNVIGPEGLLKGKTRVFVTNALTYLPMVDHIVVMKDGGISEQGSYEALMANKGQFHKFLFQYLAEVEAADEEIDEDLTALKEQLVKQIDDPTAAILPKTDGTDHVSSVAKVKHLTSTRTVDAAATSEMSEVVQISASVRSRTAETVSKPSATKAAAAVAGQNLIEAEKSATGKVNWKVYLYYARSIGPFLMGCTILGTVISQAFAMLGNIWLTKWSVDENSNEPDTRDKYIGVYGALGILQAVFIMAAAILFTNGAVIASRDLNKNMLANVLRSAMSFFDVTPTGRIVNRFAKDMDTIDIIMPMTVRSVIQFFCMVLATFIVILIATPIFIVVLIPCIVVYYFVQFIYVTSSRQLKRIESVTRSPIYSHFGETVQGSTLIRAYGKEHEFIHMTEQRVDANQKSYIPSIMANRWVSLFLELIGNVMTFFAAIFAVLARETISPGVVGLSITYAQAVTQLLYIMVRYAAELETNIVAVERIKEYCETPQEAQWHLPHNKPQKDWPEEGVVKFSKYATRYRDGLSLVVKDIDCTFNAGEKVGIVGRTGAGKSSLTLALFRIIEAAAGHIIIDGVDIAKIGLHDLRSRLTIIPQDPVLFTGTLRMNLDPFEQYSDKEVLQAVEHAHLNDHVGNLEKGLQHVLSEGGEDFSAGQRQLVCLARALLRKTRVLVLDEATAAVDLETDDLIQKTIREEFKSCTVITIAHRLNTIMDSDRILVLDKGMVKEFASPDSLLQDTSSIFYGMAKEAGLV